MSAIVSLDFEIKKMVSFGPFVVYGSAQDDLKNDFLAEFAGACGAESHPFIKRERGFNIMRRAEDKSNKKI